MRRHGRHVEGVATVLRKIIAAGLLGSGLSAVAMVPTAIAAQSESEILEKIDLIRDMIVKQDDKLRKMEDDIKDINKRINRLDTVTPVQVNPVQHSARVVHIHRHYYYPRYWCPPPWWGPW
jgi:septal ring factor EnvC (AmiA/AmiB activator)